MTTLSPLSRPSVRPPRHRWRIGHRTGALLIIAGGLAVALTLAFALDVWTDRSEPAHGMIGAPTLEPTPLPATTPPVPPPTTPAVAAPTRPAQKVAAATTLRAAVDAAVAAGRARHERVAVAVYDRQAKRFYVGGDADQPYASASVMKVFIAARLLVDGTADDPAIRSTMRRMIVYSDDAAANKLYPAAGGAAVASWAAEHYHVTGITPTARPNYWGLTMITARALVTFYDAVAADPAVGPWLLDAMGSAATTAADDFAQLFGIPAATKGWRVKQGWMCCLDNKTRMHSTGFVGGDRYPVALLTEGGRDAYGDYGAQTLTRMAQALLPNGVLPR